MNKAKKASKSQRTERTPYFEAVARLHSYHEAGHVVVAHALGWPVLWAAAGRGLNKVRFGSQGILDPLEALNDHERTERKAALRVAMTVFVAGTVAATIHQKAAEEQGFASGWE